MAKDDDFQTRSLTNYPPMPRLTKGTVRVVDGPDVGASRQLGEGGRIVVGSGSQSSLAVGDKRVSRQHCEISLGKRGFLVRDLDSRNGTWFKGSRIREVAVAPGALVHVGDSCLSLVVPSAALRIEPSHRRSFGQLLGSSAAMRRVYSLLERVASSDMTVLFRGETGTGKELAARAIHAESPRAAGPFVVFDCAAADPELVKTALFGYLEPAASSEERGGRQGAVERAEGGTLFLDELADVPVQLQSALLRICDHKSFRPFGSDRDIAADVRIIAATRGDLAAEVAAKRFREDLYYRIQVMTVTLPPLRDRTEDLPILCRSLLEQLGATAVGPIDGANLAQMVQYEWPGNVRQLRNVLERALAFCGDSVAFCDMPFELEGDEPGVSASPFSCAADASFQQRKQQVIEQFERAFLKELMGQFEGNIRRASRASGIERTQLKRLLRRHDLR